MTTTKWAYVNVGRRAEDNSGRCLVAYERRGKLVARTMLFLN